MKTSDILRYLTVLFWNIGMVCSFTRPNVSARLPFALRASSIQNEKTIESVDSLSTKIETAIAARKDPEDLLCQLESLNTTDEPNRSKGIFGEWHVWYTNCPPPSNGQLGPFQGTAGQVIEGSGSTSYQNLLKVPPNDWLTATLDGIWEDWDGVYLGDTNADEQISSKKSSSSDWGADHWKVTFLRLRIALFGLKIVNKEFPPGTARVWRTTYLDDEIRIVRAGKTGRLSDEVVFYTKRSVAPKL